MIVYGASGHGKVIIDIIKSSNNTVDFVVDDNPEIKELQGYPVRHEIVDEMRNSLVVLAVGNNSIRRKLSINIDQKFSKALIHNTAVVAESVSIGEGSVVMANSVINSSTNIGKHAIVNSGSIVEHDVYMDDFVHVSPGAIITGNVSIGEGTHIGAGATVIPGVRIGKWATIGAGAVIIKDIPDNAVVVGNPGQIIKFNTIENE